MIFKPRQKRNKSDLLSMLNNHRLERVRDVVFLGEILDEHMFWKLHISHVAIKISKSIGIIYKGSFCLCRGALRTLYYALVYPYLH